LTAISYCQPVVDQRLVLQVDKSLADGAEVTFVEIDADCGQLIAGVDGIDATAIPDGFEDRLICGPLIGGVAVLP